MRSASRLALSCCAIAAVAAACSPRAPAPASSPTAAPSQSGRGPYLHITGRGTAKQPVRFVSEIGNRKQYVLVASSYESFGKQGNSVTTALDVHVIFYGKHGEQLIADSAKAIADESTNTITLVGNVKAHSASRMTLDCDTLRYDRSTEMIHGEGHVVMTDPHGMRATGNSVDTDITLTRARMQ